MGRSRSWYRRSLLRQEPVQGGGGGRRPEAVSGDRGFPRGGSGARNGFGGFERQTSERSGGWYDRDRQQPNEDVNGVISPRKGYTRPPQSIWDMPVSEPEPVIPDHNKPMTSIWNDPISGHPEQSESPVHPREMMQS